MNEGLARGLGGANVAHVSIVPREAVGGAEARGAADTSLLIRLSPDVLMAAVFSGHGAHGAAAAHAAATAIRKFMTEHQQWLLTNPKEALANACHIASAAVRVDTRTTLSLQ